MSCYLNPKDYEKEDFLEEYGIRQESKPVWKEIPPDQFAVCLIGNGNFYSAVIFFSKGELEYHDVSDTRPTIWFLVPSNLSMATTTMVADLLL